MRKLIFALFMFFSLPALANTVYISQAGGAFSGGSACNGQTAQAVTYFNSSANWTTGTPTGTQIGPGTEVILCGTISSQLVFQGSGNSTSSITLLFDTGAILSSTGTAWNANSPIYMTNQSYIVIDGGISTVGGSTTNLEATGNGSGLSTQLSVIGIMMDGASNITVQNFECGPLYLHTSSTDTQPGADSSGCLYANPQGANITVKNSTFHDTTDGILFAVADAGNLNMNVYGNDFYNIDHDLFTSCNSSGASGFYFHNNAVHDPANWDTGSLDAFHHDGWILDYNSGQTCADVYDYDNHYYGDWGQNNTSPIFWDDNGGTLDSAYVFNDVFQNSNASYTWSNGINAMPSYPGGPAHLWNNTIVCPVSGGIGLQSEGQNLDVRNNVSTGCATFFDTSNATSATVAAFDYNFYAALTASGNPAFAFLTGNSGTGSLATQFSAWQTLIGAQLSGAETHSAQGTTANLNGSGQPQSGSPVIGAGENLTSICSGQPIPGLGALCSDAAGVARPSTGAWDIGAYQYTSSPATAGAPPSLLLAFEDQQ